MSSVSDRNILTRGGGWAKLPHEVGLEKDKQRVYVVTRDVLAAIKALEQSRGIKNRKVEFNSTELKQLLTTKPYLLKQGNYLSLISVQDAIKILGHHTGKGIGEELIALNGKALEEIEKEEIRRREIRREEGTQWVEITKLEQTRKPKKIPSIAFGAAEWARHFGDVGEEPSLPSDIEAILNSSCPFWPGKKVYETHLLTLIPSSVDRKPLTLDLLEKLIDYPLDGKFRTKCCISPVIKNQFGNVPTSASHWVLMTRRVLPGTSTKSYADEKRIAANYRDYRIPKVLETVTSILTEYVKTGNKLYSNGGSESYTFSEELDDAGFPLVVGAFATGGLEVSNEYFSGGPYTGLSLLRAFIGH